MAKQRFISAVLLCAFAVIFAHSVTPHHHDEEEFEHHQTSHHDDHNDIDHNFLGQALSHLQHEAGSTFVYETATPDLLSSKVSFDKNALLVVQYIVQVLHKPPIKHAEPPPVYFASSCYSVTTLLRGPPALVA